MSRQTRSMTEEAARRLESHRRDGESFTDFALRIAAVLDGTEDGTAVTVTDRNDSDCCDVPDDVLTEAHLKDIQTIVDRRVEQLEEQFR